MASFEYNYALCQANALFYFVSFFNLECDIKYFFVKPKFIRVTYVWHGPFSKMILNVLNNERYIEKGLHYFLKVKLHV